jgi:dCMP deaminase
MIIGVTGLYGAGKDTVSGILQEMNFAQVSFSQILREDLAKHKKPLTRINLINHGNYLRKHLGPSVLAQKALEKIRDGENHVFTSIRNPFEVRLLQKRRDFLLINIIVPENVRLKRIIQAQKANTPKSLKELKQREKLESGNDPNAQQLHVVNKMAKVTINNNCSLNKLKAKVQKLIEDWIYKLQETRPDWDTYFMDIAEQIKQRATCMSAKKGTVIVREKQILSTGYNGSPKGITHCNKGGCIRCTNRHLGKIKSGVYSEPCICAHSEENAIVQAAYNGVATKGATLYTTFTPCTTCCKMIINAGIVKVIAKVSYPDDVGTKMLKEAGIRLEVLDRN